MWYLVISRALAPREQIQALTPEHNAWLKEHHDAGDLVFTGPTVDGSVGIWVIRATSHDEAKKIADSSVYHQRRLREYEMFDWKVNQFMGQGPFSTDALRALEKERSGNP